VGDGESRDRGAKGGEGRKEKSRREMNDEGRGSGRGMIRRRDDGQDGRREERERGRGRKREGGGMMTKGVCVGGRGEQRARRRGRGRQLMYYSCVK
jgi:hypothetical protein